MKKIFVGFILMFAALISSTGNSFAATPSPAPTPTSSASSKDPALTVSGPTIIDQENLFDQNEKTEIQASLDKTNSQSGIWIIVYTSGSPEVKNPNYAVQVSTNLNLNQVNSGKTVLVSMSKSQKSFVVLPNSGVKQYVDNATLSTIISNYTPELKNDQWAQGTLDTVNALNKVFVEGKGSIKTDDTSASNNLFILVTVGIFVLLIVGYLVMRITDINKARKRRESLEAKKKDSDFPD